MLEPAVSAPPPKDPPSREHAMASAPAASPTAAWPDGEPRVGIWGCGRMAEAMLSRWLAAGALEAAQVHAVVRRDAHAAALRERHGVRADGDVAAMLAASDVVLLAIKPQQLAALAAAVGEVVRPGTLWISVLAGVRLDTLRGALGAAAPWLRAMPNTPCRIGLGATALCADAALAPAVRRWIEANFATLGATFWLGEAEIDAFTAIAGSGPAYLFAFAEALEAAAVAEGFDPDRARALTTATLRGASALLAVDGRPAAALREEVVSPGGTTAAALEAFAAGDFVAIIAAGVHAARKRSVALAADARPPKPTTTVER